MFVEADGLGSSGRGRAQLADAHAVFTQRLSVALAGQAGVVVRYRVVADEREAADAGMHGSPTLLIDGADPFDGSDRLPGLSCRLYRDAGGQASGAPSVQALRRVLAEASRG